MKFPPATDVRKMRTSLDITQMELSERSGVSQSTIAKIERGKIDASYETVVNLFETLDNMRSDLESDLAAIDVCSKKVVSIDQDSKVNEASILMRSTGFSQLPVFSNGMPVGSITEKNLLELISKGYSMEELSRMPVSRVMGESYPVVLDTTPVNTVAALMKDSNAILVSKKGKIVGLITNADMLKLI